MINWLIKRLTKNYKQVPLFWVDFDLNKWRKYKLKNCIVKVHPTLRDDPHVVITLEELITYVRKNYDMEELVK